MRHIASFLIIFVLALLTSCVERLDNVNYTLVCKVAPDVAPDSLSLLIYMPGYNRLDKVAAVASDGKSYTFEGQIEAPAIAMLKFSNDTAASFFFILEPGLTDIAISQNSINITGGEQNHRYITFLKQRKAIEAARRSVSTQYLNEAGGDSIINIGRERDYLKQDSLLRDSLDNITIAAINRNDLAGRIIFNNYIGTVAAKNKQKLQKNDIIR